MQIDEAFGKLNIVQDFIPVGNSNRPGNTLVATKITIHNTDNDNPGANAAAHAKYQKGPDAREREVSWHYTVDDKAVYQSLPTNEIGWHAGPGNGSSIAIEICMHPEMDVAACYERAALLVAVLSFQHKIPVAGGVVQHNFWTGKHCPRVLRDKPNGWKNFIEQIKGLRSELENVPADNIAFMHHEEAGLVAKIKKQKAKKAKKKAMKKKGW